MQSDSHPTRYLVTGASGFVGRALCHRLLDAGTVRGLSRRRPSAGPWDSYVARDVAGDEPLDGALDGVDIVFHLAGLAHDVHAHASESEYDRINVRGTRRVLEAAERARVSAFVFLSSVKAIGEGGEDRVDDDVPPGPVSAYGRSKLAAERRVTSSGVPHRCVLRSTLVYGAGVKGNIARMVRAVAAGHFPPPPPRRNHRSAVHRADLVTALVQAARRPEANGGTYIISDGRAFSTRELYEGICRALGRPIPGWQVPWPVLAGAARVGDVASWIARRPMPFDSAALRKLMGSSWFESSRAERDLAFTPVHSLAETLPEIVASLDA